MSVTPLETQLQHTQITVSDLASVLQIVTIVGSQTWPYLHERVEILIGSDWGSDDTLTVSQFRFCILRRSIWRLITSQRLAKTVPIRRLLQMQLTNTPSSLSFWRMHCYHSSWPHISQNYLCDPKRSKKEREKMATSRGVDRHFRRPGQQKSWRKGKTSGDATRKCSEG